MNYVVDCFGRCSQCVTSKLEDVPNIASNQNYAAFRRGTTIIGSFFIVPKKVCWHAPNKKISSSFAGCIQRRRFECFHGHHQFNFETPVWPTVTCGFQSKSVPESTEPASVTQQKPFRSTVQSASASSDDKSWMRYHFIAFATAH